MNRVIKKGARAERELARRLWSMGIAVIRGPASGSGTRKLYYPDLVAIKNRNVAVIEVKYRSKLSPIRLDKEKIERLVEFARRAGARLFLAVKLPGEWRIIELNWSELLRALNDRESRALVISEDKIRRGMSLNAFASSLGSASIKEYFSAG